MLILKRNKRFDKFINDFVLFNDLFILSNFSKNHPYENGDYFSCIDHCLMHNNVNAINFQSYYIDDYNNHSDHKPLFTTILYEGLISDDPSNKDDENSPTLYKINPNLNNDETKFNFFKEQLDQFYVFNLAQIDDKHVIIN